MQGVEMSRGQRREFQGGSDPVHEPVLSREVADLLAGPGSALRAASDEARDGWWIDATLGAGGHAGHLLEALPHVRLLGIDQDPEILDIARVRLAAFGERATLECARISQLEDVAGSHAVGRVLGILLDLGASSLQLDRPERGFSFQIDGPLDMRMDPTRERTAADILNTWDESDLADLFYYEGGESRSRRIARAVTEARRRAPFQRTQALVALVERCLGPRRSKLHSATRVFQALRRAVNEEGEELLAGLALAERRLAEGGRLAVISFHSGEDGVVKRFVACGVREGRWKPLTKKPIRAGQAEARLNRRARSASLRAAERTTFEEQGR